MKQKVLGIVAGVTTLLAALIATSACWIFLYQPEEPECLKDE